MSKVAAFGIGACSPFGEVTLPSAPLLNQPSNDAVVYHATPPTTMMPGAHRGGLSSGPLYPVLPTEHRGGLSSGPPYPVLPSESSPNFNGAETKQIGFRYNEARHSDRNAPFGRQDTIDQNSSAGPLMPLMIENRMGLGTAAVEATYSEILDALKLGVKENQLDSFYKESALIPLATKFEKKQTQIVAFSKEYNLTQKQHLELYRLALYDTVIVCDDSGSMVEPNEGRIDELKDILKFATRAAALFDNDGISVRFLNNRDKGVDNITDPANIEALIKSIHFDGLTPLGETLEEVVIDPMCLSKLKKLKKPVSCIVITDGVPSPHREGEIVIGGFDHLENVLKCAYKKSMKKHAIAFSFSQVGKDEEARRFLNQLDNHDDFGKMVDVTSNREYEQAERARVSPDQPRMTKEQWYCKLLLGGINRSYDVQDEPWQERRAGFLKSIWKEFGCCS